MLYFFLCCIDYEILKKKLQKNNNNKINVWAQPFSTLIIIRSVPWTAKQHIRVISEGSCDTENWMNDSDHRIKLHLNI